MERRELGCVPKRCFSLQSAVMERRKNVSRKSPKRKCYACYIKGLHSCFERNGGRLSFAMVDSNRSMDEKENKDYTYSEFGKLMRNLKGI